MNASLLRGALSRESGSSVTTREAVSGEQNGRGKGEEAPSVRSTGEIPAKRRERGRVSLRSRQTRALLWATGFAWGHEREFAPFCGRSCRPVLFQPCPVTALHSPSCRSPAGLCSFHQSQDQRERGRAGGREGIVAVGRPKAAVGRRQQELRDVLCGSRSKCRNTSRVTLIKTQAIFTPRSSEIVQGREGGKSKQELRGNRCPGAKEEGRSHAKPSGNTGERATPH